jgi:hypothetical protein
MNVNVIVEKGTDNRFSAFMDYTGFDFGLSGFGQTAEEAIKDFYKCWEEEQGMLKQEKKEIPELEFNIKHDVTAFLDYYNGILSKSGLERITGINQKQLWHYSSGRRRPTKKTALRIQTNLHRFADSLKQVQFID